jgi:hypothetical protein
LGYEETPRFPLLRILLGNAFLLSGIYLVVGLALEVLRRIHEMDWMDSVFVVMDRLPARVLMLVGLLPKLREMYIEDQLPGYAVRLVFGLTTVVVIYALAVVVGAGMWTARRLWEWRAGRASTRHP